MRIAHLLPLLGVLVAPGAFAQQAPQALSHSLVVLPYVHPGGQTVDLSLAARWNLGVGGGLNTQVQAWNGVPLVVGGSMRTTGEFQRNSVPGLGRTPFVGGLFRSSSQTTRTRHMDYTFITTAVDPAGFPLHTPGTQPFERWQVPPMTGLVR